MRTIRPKSKMATVRQAAVAGRFYPANSVTLRNTVRRYLDNASVPVMGQVCALIVPHAGYVCSGPVAAYGYQALSSLSKSHRYTVYLMGPAHCLPVHGVGLSAASSFQTPLGSVVVDTEDVEQLLALGDPFCLADAAHSPEHCLEVQLPFLQVVLPHLRVVPMLFDQEADPQEFAEKAAPILLDDERNLIVVSSDLSHFHPYAEAMQRDGAFLQTVIAGDLDGVRHGEACGVLPILCLMQLARRLGWTPHLLNYRNSGDTCGSKLEVVGYGVVAYCKEPLA